MSVNIDGSLCTHGSLSLRIDGHCDTVTALLKGKARHIDIDNIDKYVDLQFFALYIEAEGDTEAANKENDVYYKYYLDMLASNEKIKPILFSKDLDNIQPGTVGSLLAIENSEPLAADSEAIYRLYDKGYRSFGITWSNNNSLGGGANTSDGLTDLGRSVIKKCNELPVVVDLAHMNRKSFFDSMSLLEKSPVVTHSCCYGLCHHKRNLEDDALSLLAESNGIFGVTFVRSFLQDDNMASLDRIVDHIIYAADIMGIDKVALGSDFDGTDLPLDMEGQSSLEKLWYQMRVRDFSEDEILAVQGGNWQRLLKETLGDVSEV